jgi:hypothetical protein
MVVILAINGYGVMRNVGGVFLVLLFVIGSLFYSGFAGLTPLASHSLPTATKSNQKRSPITNNKTQ